MVASRHRDGSSDPGCAGHGLFTRIYGVCPEAIVSAIREGRTEIENAATFEDGVKVQRVLDAARESNRTGAEASPLA